MGWWQVTMEGEATAGATGMIWGDELADIMDRAIGEIRTAYEAEWHRRPTRREIEAGLSFSLSDEDA